MVSYKKVSKNAEKFFLQKMKHTVNSSEKNELSAAIYFFLTSKMSTEKAAEDISQN